MNGTSPLILVVEDEKPMRRFLEMSLEDHGYRTLSAEIGEEGLRLARSHQPNLMLLDLGLPDIDGLDVIHRLREWSQMPIVVLSARGQEKDKVEALDEGADDYLTKPFGNDELLARIRVELRHAERMAKGNEPDQPVFEVGDLTVDLGQRQVMVRGEEVNLTPIEFRLLATFVKNAGKVLQHRFLLKKTWGPDAVEETHYLRVYMAKLREKIENNPARPQYLRTEQGVGYRLVTDPS